MARQYTRRETANQNPDGLDPAIDKDPEGSSTVDAPAASATQDDAKDGATQDDAKTETAPVEPKKAKTRAQTAREEAARVRAAQDEATILGSPTFQVTYPAGISLHAPGKDEVEVTMSGGGKVWIDVVGEHVHVPNEARIRASSVQELTDFTRMASQGLLKQVVDSL